MNYYEILGVGPDANDQQIKEAYRREAMKWHPDRHDGAAAKGEADRRFKDLAVAYRTLRNATARADYDRQLDQQLRREYEARQQEQARQQRAQSEQAQRDQAYQKHARPEQPGPDFADTQTPYEDETASADDANQMFYEQMLDLAFELAGRGFPEFNILKALIALGCPEALAKAVAATAAKQGHSKGANSASDMRETPPLSNFDDASFEEMEPYYVAAIMGPELQNPLSPERYKAVVAKRKGRGDFWLGLGFVVLIISIVVAVVGKSAEVFPYVIFAEILFLILWVLSRNMFLGPDHRRFRAEEIKRYYLDCFRALHQEHRESATGIKAAHLTRFKLPSLNAGAFIAAFGWIGYRRQPAVAFIWAAIYATIGYAIALAESSGNFKWPSGASIGLAVGFSIYANRLYFGKVRSNILNAIDQPTQNQALARLRKNGGTNSSGWILPGVFFILLLIPLGVMIEEEGAAKAQLVQEQRAAQAAVEQGASEARQRAAAQQAQSQTEAEYARALAAIEAKYPQLNPDSPSYTQAAADWVIERKKIYDQGGGRSPATSLNQAVTDYEVAMERNHVIPQKTQAELSPLMSEYILHIKTLSRKDRNFQAIADMGVKFPKMNGYLSYVKGAFSPKHAVHANLVENTQTWGFNRSIGPQSGFIVFQNMTNQHLKGITVEIQAEERSCEQKGDVYYMTLEFDRAVAPASVVGIDFQFPNVIPNANRCMDVVDLIFG